MQNTAHPICRQQNVQTLTLWAAWCRPAQNGDPLHCVWLEGKLPLRLLTFRAVVVEDVLGVVRQDVPLLSTRIMACNQRDGRWDANEGDRQIVSRSCSVGCPQHARPVRAKLRLSLPFLWRRMPSQPTFMMNQGSGLLSRAMKSETPFGRQKACADVYSFLHQ